MNTNMDYSLSAKKDKSQKLSARAALIKMAPLFATEKKQIGIAFCAVLINAALNLVGPLVVGYTIDTAITNGDYRAVLMNSVFLLGIYICAFAVNYIQMRTMGGVAQRTLFRLRNDVFAKLQSLPIAFFRQNKTGDLISRINSDTDKLNQFFSQGLMRFAGNIFLVIGAGIFILCIQVKLGIAALLPALIIFIFTRIVAAWVKKASAQSLTTSGLLSAEIQESITNFKVIIAFNRRDYFKQKFNEVNKNNFRGAFGAGIANELFTPVFEFLGNIAQLIVLGVGFYFIAQGQFAIGLLVSFILYVTRFYDPLREMARLWSTFQIALAAWDRIGLILHMESNLKVINFVPEQERQHAVMEFKDVSFSYPDGDTKVLSNVDFMFEKGRTYAFVGPTGGGKTTSASLIARLFDPTKGVIYLHGKDIRSYEPAVLAQHVGFILQEPFLFTGTVRENIAYGNPLYTADTLHLLETHLTHTGLSSLVSRFSKGLDTLVTSQGGLSLGERQIIAFIRAVLRKPDVLVLDEATANIDTVTEEILQTILEKLPKHTVRVVIAHRLNTIENADEIFFVNGGEVVQAGSMEHAVEMLLHGKRKS